MTECIALMPQFSHSSKNNRKALGRTSTFIKLFLFNLLIMTGLFSYESLAKSAFEDFFRLQLAADTTDVDSLQVVPIPINEPIADSILSADTTLSSSAFINASIFYDAADSLIFDLEEKMVRMYNNAVVRFDGMELKAAYIEYSFVDNLACAQGLLDTAGVLYGVPEFKDDGPSFSQKSLCFNFRTKKGYSHEVLTQDGDAYLHAETAKRHTNDWIHIKDGKFTTCDAENPHFHFHITKGVVVPSDKIVTGPVYLKVRKVPLPLALPFAWFPNKKESSHGIILPGYGNANQLGFFLKGAGYYVPIGDYLDNKVTFDLYSRGSWNARNVTNYRKKYKYNGNLDISRTVTKVGFSELPTYSKRTDFFVRWNHNQDIKARPNTRFGASINAGTSSNFRNTLSSNQNDVISNTFTSSVNWSKSWKSKYNLSIQARHSQNTLNGNVDIVLPSVSFSRNRFDLPLGFLNRSKSMKKKWYEKIGVSYSMNTENLLNTNDSLLSLNNLSALSGTMRNGLKMQGSASTSLKAMNGFVTINPSFNYNEYWTAQYVTQSLDLETLTTQVDTLYGFKRGNNWSAGLNASTKIYGTYALKNSKKVKAFRHVMTPNIGLSYDPFRDFRTYGFFGDGGEFSSYSQFDISRYSPSNRSEAGAITFGLQNNLEMKVRDKSAKKVSYKKVKLIESLNLTSNYNLVADSLNLAPISLRAYTKIGSKLNMTINSRFSAYDRDSTGVRINTYMWDSQRKLARMENFNVAFNTSLKSKNKTGEKKTDGVTDDEMEILDRNQDAFVDFSVPWSVNAKYNFNLQKQWQEETQKDSLLITQAIMLNGDFSLFKNWKIGFNTGYDFVANKATITTLNLYWDLHCWEASFTWVPIGPLKSYSVQLNVKSAMLQDLKLQRRGNLGQGDVLY